MAKSITYLPMMGVYANSCSGYKLVIGKPLDENSVRQNLFLSYNIQTLFLCNSFYFNSIRFFKAFIKHPFNLTIDTTKFICSPFFNGFHCF